MLSSWHRVAVVLLVLGTGSAGCGDPGAERVKGSPDQPSPSCSDENSPEDRIVCYEAALRASPQDTSVLGQLATALTEAGRSTVAVERLTEAVRLDPDDPELRYQLGVVLSELGDMDGAIEEYEEVLELVASPEVHVLVGMLLSEKDRHNEAVTHYEQALVLSPDDVDAHYNLGVELGSEGRYGDAAEHYREVVRLDESHGEAANNLGAALFAGGKPEEASRYFERALRLDPADVQARGNLAMALRAQDRVGEAINVLEEGLSRSPEAVQLANQLAWLRATAREARWRDGKEAVRLAESACQSADRSEGNYLDTLAAAYAEAGRYSDAVRTAGRAIELAGENPALASEFRQRLSLYQEGKPYREPNYLLSPSSSDSAPPSPVI